MKRWLAVADAGIMANTLGVWCARSRTATSPTRWPDPTADDAIALLMAGVRDTAASEPRRARACVSFFTPGPGGGETSSVSA